MTAPRKLEIYIARVVPPWLNMSMVIRGPEGAAMISMACWSRGWFVRALEYAGFEVAVSRSWLETARWHAGF